ncbi:D-isomer specific 2-hydroxyacid dehydrogenase NAD-binding protein [Thermaerobacter marianensis DSM 12885]|uniref:D-isomer specific 2-hydroxyacid dehydrogenase NAD-binding protein n=1 Tax=Thermaerobacter marianensis (strain ATCC 700841 / DSM 12885 / JCM 10246 / 7p75a) TaxID=644966 RepID=E6SK67_THEM7|nr:D-2-hydroxyacid dehydrogenase [Thermaerobacter marianensis]ADU51208.1 D-isomer specific 2-hydroxyacid dehydrogenase NAD-binding protein [Thermaerobacter marianensis DSM 12885]
MTLEILCTVPLTPEQAGRIEAEVPEGRLRLLPGRVPQEELDEAFAVADVAFLFGRELTPGRLAAARRLRWIQCAYAGVDAMLAAVPELRQHPVVLTNARGMHAATIADHVFMLMLAWARNLPGYLDQQRRRQWKRLPTRELAGETLAVVGLGAIGREVARRAGAFGMRVLACRRHPVPEEGIDQVVGPGDLPRILAPAQWVVVSAALTPETRHLIGREQLAVMRPDAFLINIARGAVVDEQALIEALRRRQIAGAGLDVFAEEPLPPDHPLWELDNVLITPHNAGAMRDYTGAALELFLENLRRFLRGEPLRNVVDKERGY